MPINEQFPTTAQMDDLEFQKFVMKVTPPGQIRQVWIGTVIMILYYVFKLLQELGFFERLFFTMKVKRAMRRGTEADRERELAKVKAELSWYDEEAV